MSVPKSLKDTRYCDYTRSTDNMLKIFKHERCNILTTLIQTPFKFIDILWTDDSPISIDRKCLCQMGRFIRIGLKHRLNNRSSFNPIVGSTYKCPQCINMGRLTNLRETNIGDNIVLESGNEVGNHLIVEEENIGVLNINIRDDLPSKFKLMSTDNDLYISSDVFTNNILVNYYINYITNASDIPNVRKLYTSFVCRDTGYMLYENPEYKTINNLITIPELSNGIESIEFGKSLSRNVVAGILNQLFSILHLLENYNFVFGNVNYSSILFSNKPCNYIYDNKHISCPITLKLTQFGNSSITVLGVDKKIRLYTSNNIAKHQLGNSLDHHNIIQVDKNRGYTISNRRYNPKNIEIYKYMKDLGLALCNTSFNVYSTFTMLMSNWSFYNTVMNDDKLRSVWINLWIPEDYALVNNELSVFHTTGIAFTAEYTVDIFLSKYKLKCDILTFSMNLMR